MRLGKSVLLKEADSLLGYTDGILRDLKNAEMAIREINSTWHDTARGVGLLRALPFRDSARVCFNYHLY